LSEAEVEHLCSYFTEHTFDANDVIIRRGEPIKYLYYISKGIVHEKNGVLDDPEAPKIKNRPGDILGLQFVAKEGGRSFTNCYAKTVCTCRTFPVSVLIDLLHGDSEKEQKIWNYIGPSIIHLNPNTFTRLQELDPMQIKVLQKNSEYLSFEPGSIVPLQNGGILYEGTLEEKGDESMSEEDSLISESEKGFGNKRKVRIKSYAFIYPTTTHYISKSPVRIYSFPLALKESWLSFNPQVLMDAFSILPGVQASAHMHTVRNSQDTLRRKQKTILLGIAKDLAHQDPLQTLRNRTGRLRRGNNNEARGFDFKMEEGVNAEHTIMPKGYTRNLASSIKINNNERKAFKPVSVNEQNSESDEESKGERSTKEGLDRVRTRDIKLNINKPGESVESSSTETPELEIDDNSYNQNGLSEQSDEASNKL
jgi:hypothetical protein